MPLSGRAREKKKSLERYRDFRGMDPDYIDEYAVPDNSVYWEIGTLDAVDYTTVRDGDTEHYRHTFKKSARPKLVVSADGKELRIVGGRFRVTERGIVDQ